MTLSTAIPRVSYAGNGATTSFAFSFKVFAAADLKVYLRDNVSLQDTLQVLTTNYTVSGTFPGTGNVVFGVAPPSGKTVIILRDPAVDQALDLIASGSFAAENVETALDKLASYVQSLAQRATWLEGNVTVDFASIASGALSAAQNITVTGAAIARGGSFGSGNAATSSWTERNRTSGSFAKARATTLRNGSLMADRSGSAVRCFINTSPTLSPSNGTRPVSISYKMMPRA